MDIGEEVERGVRRVKVPAIPKPSRTEPRRAPARTPEKAEFMNWIGADRA